MEVSLALWVCPACSLSLGGPRNPACWERSWRGLQGRWGVEAGAQQLAPWQLLGESLQARLPYSGCPVSGM